MTVKINQYGINAVQDNVIEQPDLKANLAGNGPAFYAYRNAAVSSGAGALIYVACDVEVFDTNNNFASGNFTPTVAGYYQFNGAVQVAESHNIRAILIKNGATTIYGNLCLYASSVGGLVYMNGTTDTISLGVADATGSFNVTTGQSITFFSGFLARAA